MNICHVIDMISQTKAGGSAKVPYYMAREQARLGYKVAIYASDYNAVAADTPEGVELRTFKCLLNFLGGVRVSPGMAFAGFKQFDIVHLHNYRTLVNIIASSKGVPVVLQAHGSCRPIIGRLTVPIHNLVWRGAIFNKAGAYIADSDGEIDQYLIEGAKQCRIHVVPVGIDMAEYAVLPERRQGDKKSILYLGRLHYNKGVDLLIKAVDIMNRDDVELRIAGTDDGYGEIMKRSIDVAGLYDKVRLLGPLYGEAKLQEYVNADVYVMPSRFETWGLTFMEAMACGAPLVMTDQCEAAKQMPDYARVVAEADAVSLAYAITKVIDSDMANTNREKRRKWIRRYDWANIVPDVMKVYEAVLNGK